MFHLLIAFPIRKSKCSLCNRVIFFTGTSNNILPVRMRDGPRPRPVTRHVSQDPSSVVRHLDPVTAGGKEKIKLFHELLSHQLGPELLHLRDVTQEPHHVAEKVSFFRKPPLAFEEE